ncbi:MAG: hypothetical protein SOI66_00010 [Bifidobacterium sp.]|jgi:hypothetical protein
MSEASIVAIVVAVVGSGGFGTLTAWLTRRMDRTDPTVDAMRLGLRELLFCELEGIHADMVRRGFCPVQAKTRADRIYTAYHALGGNGVGTSMVEDIRHAHIAPDPAGSR